MGMLRRDGPSVEARIADAIAGMRPLLPLDHGRVELLRFDHDARVAVLRVEGGCPDCEMSAVTLLGAIEAHLRLRVPEIVGVRCEASSGAPARSDG